MGTSQAIGELRVALAPQHLDAGDTTTRPTDGSCRSATARRFRRTGVAAGARTADSPARAGPPTVAATAGHAP
jgi:hypothetical protein